MDGFQGSNKPRGGRRRPTTKLQKFLDANGLTSVQLESVTGISRPSMSRIRAGGDVRRKTMLRILDGARTLVRDPVRMDELFDLEPETGNERG